MELRAGYKQTEVGVIPEDWDDRTLQSCVRSIVRGASPRPIDDPKWFDNTSSVGWLRISDVTSSKRYLLETVQRLSDEGIRHSRKVPTGGLVMSICATVGRPIETRINVCIHDGFVLFDQPMVEQNFLFYVLTDLEPRWASKGQTGSQMNLNTGLIKGTKIAVPQSSTEQTAIATALGDVDALLAAQDAMIEKKRGIKQGAMQELLTGKRRLPGFSGEWEEKRLGEIGVFLKGSGVRKDEAKSGELPCVRYGEIYTQHDFYIKEFSSWISKEVATTATRLVQGDLLFAGSGETKEEIGKCIAFHDDLEAYAGGDIVILRTKGTHPIFMGYACNQAAIQKQKAGKGQGDAVVHIGASALAGIEILMPSLEEQAAIADVLFDMDTEIVTLETQRTKTAQLKQGMMQALLTGRIRLV